MVLYACALTKRALNKITVQGRYPLFDIVDLPDKLQGCMTFSSLDLQSGYHQIRINDEDKPKTAMVTPFGQFQFKVLCFVVKDGISVDPANIAVIEKWSLPRSLKELQLQAFLGLANNIWNFVEHFSTVVA
eukprot:1152879-Pelagomonas_calceolata.AAC.2